MQSLVEIDSNRVGTKPIQLVWAHVSLNIYLIFLLFLGRGLSSGAKQRDDI